MPTPSARETVVTLERLTRGQDEKLVQGYAFAEAKAQLEQGRNAFPPV